MFYAYSYIIVIIIIWHFHCIYNNVLMSIIIVKVIEEIFVLNKLVK